MKFEKFPIPAELASLVKSIWMLESDVPAKKHLDFAEYTLFANAFPSMVFQYKGLGFLKVSIKKKSEPVPLFHLYGPSPNPVDLVTSGSFGMFGIDFLPYAIKLLFGLDAVDITSQVVDLNLLPGLRGHHLPEAVSIAKTNKERFKCLISFLTDLAIKANKPDPIIEAGVNYIYSNKGLASIDQLCKYLGYSTRQVERKFKDLNGLSPKLYSRIIRFQCSIKNFNTGTRGSLNQLALNSGYADQAHFIREFSEFSSLSPRHFFINKEAPILPFVKH